MQQKRVAFIVIFLIILGILAFSTATYFYSKQKTPGSIARTNEAKQCPDGSYVGRTSQDCEFAACPVTTSSIIQTTATSSQIKEDFSAGGMTPDKIKPFSTTYSSVNFTDYNNETESESVPTYLYEYKANAFRVEFGVDGQDKHGVVFHSGTISVLNADTGYFDTVSNIYTTGDELDAVYTHDNDLIFLWSQVAQYGCCTTHYSQNVLIYNPNLKKSDTRNLQYENEGENLEEANSSPAKGFSIFLKNGALYLESINGTSTSDGTLVNAYYLLQDGTIQFSVEQ